MIRPWKILLPALLLLSLISVTVVHVNAQGEQYQTLAEILPQQGGANTTILLRFTSQNTNVSNVQTADIFWDNVSFWGLKQQGTLGANGAYYYNITIPPEPPYSDVGNHTIEVDSNIAPYGQVNFTFTFTITEFIPSPEYLALNDTYNSLFTNYTIILGNYTQLLAHFNELSANYTTLLAEHNNDTLNFNTLTSQYNVLNTNYNSLTANYNLLATLPGNFTSLQANFQALNTSYATLMQDYNLLNSSYAGLLTNYNSLVGQLDFSRNLSYVLIIITIALAIIIIYFIMIKPKRNQKIR